MSRLPTTTSVPRPANTADQGADRRATRGFVFNIQSYELYDGPGIRTSVFFKGCPLRCAWCHNPESQQQTPEAAFAVDRCIGCGRCVAHCAARALVLTKKRPERNRERCRSCGECAERCPTGAQELIGTQVTVDQVVTQVLRDQTFFAQSGGGVTLTGGEPTLQAPFALALLTALHEEGLHTTLETCGAFSADLQHHLVPLVDLFLFDLKHPDPGLHAHGTGIDNHMIRERFCDLLALVGADRIVPRIPLVPNFNLDATAIQAVFSFLHDCGYHGMVHFMPVHDLARGKYLRLDRTPALRHGGGIDDGDRTRIVAACLEQGFEPVWGGY